MRHLVLVSPSIVLSSLRCRCRSMSSTCGRGCSLTPSSFRTYVNKSIAFSSTNSLLPRCVFYVLPCFFAPLTFRRLSTTKEKVGKKMSFHILFHSSVFLLTTGGIACTRFSFRRCRQIWRRDVSILTATTTHVNRRPAVYYNPVIETLVTIDREKRNKWDKIVYGPSVYLPLNLIRIGVAYMREWTLKEKK